MLANINQADVIYLATHGVANDRDPNDKSYLLLSDGAFTAREIAHLKLRNHPLVVMSACETALGKTFEPGVIGLAKAWKYAGASTVIMTLWKVFDESTRELMVEFIRHVQFEAPDLALKESMILLRDRPNPDCQHPYGCTVQPYKHPLFWSGFMIYGTPSSF